MCCNQACFSEVYQGPFPKHPGVRPQKAGMFHATWWSSLRLDALHGNSGGRLMPDV